MARYCKQKDLHSCGPVLVLNSLKWAGEKVTHDGTITPLKILCGQKRGSGTSTRNFIQALRIVGDKMFQTLTIRPRRKPTLKEMEQHLRKGGAVALEFHWVEKNGFKDPKKWKFRGHYALATAVNESGSRFTLVNAFSGGKASEKLSRNKFKKHMLGSQANLHAWFLKRRG